MLESHPREPSASARAALVIASRSHGSRPLTSDPPSLTSWQVLSSAPKFPTASSVIGVLLVTLRPQAAALMVSLVDSQKSDLTVARRSTHHDASRGGWSGRRAAGGPTKWYERHGQATADGCMKRHGLIAVRAETVDVDPVSCVRVRHR